jgi:hypothetical protein
MVHGTYLALRVGSEPGIRMVVVLLIMLLLLPVIRSLHE